MKKLLFIVLLIGIVAAIVKVLADQRAEWSNLSEDEVRIKIQAKLGTRVPEEKLEVIQDNVVSAMRGRGMIREEVATVGGNGEVEPS